jgi:hypothetical protein
MCSTCTPLVSGNAARRFGQSAMRWMYPAFSFRDSTGQDFGDSPNRETVGYLAQWRGVRVQFFGL